MLFVEVVRAIVIAFVVILLFTAVVDGLKGFFLYVIPKLKGVI